MNPWTLLTLYAILAIGVSFLCSILEAVLLSTTRGHVVSMTESHPKTSNLWIGFKDDPEKPLTAILTLNTIAHTVAHWVLADKLLGFMQMTLIMI